MESAGLAICSPWSLNFKILTVLRSLPNNFNFLHISHSDMFSKSKQEVLANLANFAYDPVNYEFMRNLNVVDLFLDCLDETDENLVEFAIGGLCNLCLDKENKELILKNDGVKLVMKCLSSTNEETVLSSITTLMYLVTPVSKAEITALPVVECMLRFSNSTNRRLSNLAKVFLEDYCSSAQIETAKQVQEKMMQQNHSQQI